ncbi:MAG: hypothetical protein Q8Q89_01935 [bacterium]|nr:hypothetical protein [bacterium]
MLHFSYILLTKFKLVERLKMHEATQYVIWLMTFSALLTTFFWFKGLYFKTTSVREALEVYVNSKHLIKSFFTASFTSVLIVVFGIMSNSILFIVLGIIWMAVFLFLFLKSRNWLKEAVIELDKMNRLTGKS